MGEHTPTPWYINVAAGPTQIAAVSPFRDIGCCFVPSGEGRKNSGTANAAFIVKACNSHDALVKALERCECLIKKVLPELMYGSALDSDAVMLLNEVPDEVREALAKVQS